MKKNIFYFIVIMFAFLLCACNTENDKTDDDSEKTYEEIWFEYADEMIPDVVTSKINVPEDFYFEDGTFGFVEFKSSNTKSISNKGLYFINVFDNYVDLTATLVHENGEIYEFEKTVFVKGAITEEDYIKYIQENVVPNNVYKDVEMVTIEKEYFKDRGIEAYITYESTNPNAITSDGKYTLTSKEDVVVTMNFDVEINGFSLSGSALVTVLGKNDQLYINNAKNWLEEEWYKDEGVTDNFVLPTSDDKGMVSFSWKSLDLDVIDHSGKFTSFVVDKVFTFEVEIKMGDTIETMEISLKTISTDEALEYIISKMHQDELYQSTFVTYIITSGYHNEDYGFMKFYTQDIDESQILISQTDTSSTYGKYANNSNVSKLEVKDGIIPRSMTHKRPLIVKPSVEFITVHDTGDNKFNAYQWMNEVTTSTRAVSWHFTVDDKDIYQHVPLDEVAYHAGDGSRVFELLDTGVKFTINNPKLEFSKDDNYLYVNGIKSKLMAPTYEGNYYYDITPAGLYTCVGENGNYFIDAYHYDKTYRAIAMNGGNRNSIGIESCIVDGMSYSRVMRNLANLVAHLLNIYDLDTSRVMQHRNFSGKLCPQSMIRAKEESVFNYANFMELVEIEYFILKCLPNVKFTYKSNNPDIMNDEGYLLKYVSEETKISYDLTIEYGDKLVTKTLFTTVYPK